MTEIDPYVEWTTWNQFASDKHRFPLALERESATLLRRIHAWDRLSVAVTINRSHPAKSLALEASKSLLFGSA